MIRVESAGAGTAMKRRAAKGSVVLGLQWVARPELGGPWRIAVCEAHGRALQEHRFRGIAAPGDRQATACAVCADADLLRVVESCTCETDTGRCPEHSNLGCSC